ncbi:MAG: endonuclease V [candidate division Zixibacteria bacterium]|nr:endonuclease V [candidate division Zixibacteria bacterium]
MKKIYQHSWDVSIEEAKKIQEELSRFVMTKDEFKKTEKVSGVGVIFSKDEDKVSVACVNFSFPQLQILDQTVERESYDFPYTPGLFAFSVGPAILSALNKIEKPDLIIFPGRGIDHPRKLGLASHLGVLLDLPTIACSKKPLWKNHPEPSMKKGAYVFIERENKELIGAVLRTKDSAKPIFVTPGHKISIQTALKIILQCSPRYRIPEPLRQAHILAKKWQ